MSKPNDTTETPPVTPAPVDPPAAVNTSIDEDERELLVSMGHDPDAKPQPEGDDAPPAAEPEPANEQEVPASQAQTEEPAQQRADGGGKDPDPAAGTKQPAPAVAESAPQTPAPPTQATRANATPAVDPLLEEMNTLTAKIMSDDYDQFSAEGKQILLRRQDVAAEISARNVRQELTQWDGYAEQHGVDAKTLKQTFEGEYKKAAKKYGDGPVAQAVATEFWLEKIATLKSPAATPTPAAASTAKPAATQAKPVAPPVKKGAQVAPPVARTPITPQGAQVIPPGANSVPPPTRQLSDEEELVAWQRRNVPGGIHSLVRG